jgi:hypothetical protein
MKKKERLILWFFLIFLLSGFRLYSHELGIGLKTGWSQSKADIIRVLPGMTFAPLNEYSFGTFLSFSLIGDRVFFQPEINYSRKGFVTLETDRHQEIDSRYRIAYIEIPLLIGYIVPLKGRLRPGLFFGPYFGFALRAVEVQTVFGQTEKRELGDNLEENDAGIVFGVNLRYRMGKASLILDVRYGLGFVNISKDITEVSYDFSENDTLKNRALTVSLGIGFNLAKQEVR